MLDRIFDVRKARLDNGEIGMWLVGGSEAHLGAGGASQRNQHIGTAAGLDDVQIESLIGLVVHQRIIGLAGAERVAKRLIWSQRVVERVVEQRAIVVGPFASGVCVGDLIGQQCADE